MNGPVGRVRLATPVVASDTAINAMWDDMAEMVARSRAHQAEMSRENPIFWPPPPS